MSINIICALAKNKTIGYKGSIPWHIPKDLKYFKKITSGDKNDNALVMGRKTWQSLPTYPNTLPNRNSYIITNNPPLISRKNITFIEMPSTEDIITMKKKHSNIWICGGQSIYEYFINKPYIDKLYLTELNSDFKGDTYFPEIPSHFHKVIQGEPYASKLNAISFVNYNFTVYSNLTHPR
jgi:dihydrofolate reductase|uniref:dihydrofolate reductase n=1 Tax=viral metagenome TaxID=1070528 RepID=A0A6C0ITY8_9ZZZZ